MESFGIKDILDISITIFVLGIGGVLVRFFIRKSFSSIDEKIKKIEDYSVANNARINVIEKDLIRVQERIKVLDYIKEKLEQNNEFKLDVVEKYSKKSDIQEELTAINDILELLLKKIDKKRG